MSGNRSPKPLVRIVAAAASLLLAVSMLVLLYPVARAESNGASALRFTILHTNDEHSELIPYGPAIDYPAHPTTGGFDRVAHEIARIKAEKAAAGEPVLTLSGGDFSQGTLFAWLETSAAAELSLMQAVGYDAVALGNHEMELGPAYRAAALNAAKANGVTLPILCANIDFDETDPADDALEALFSETDKQGTELAIQRYTIKTLPNGLKVGIFGLLGVEAEAVAPAAAPVKFGNVAGNPMDPVSFINRVLVAQEMVDTLRAAGCQVVVALSHSGTREETELPKWVTGIDVIVGGHSHDLNYPPLTVGGTIIVQAGSYTSHLGVLELEYGGGKVSVRSARAIEMNDSIPVHPGVEAAIGAYKAALNGALGFDILAPYAETDVQGDGGFFINDGPPFVETNLGDLIADSYLQTARALNPAEPPVLGFEANGVIRSNIPPGAEGRFSFYDLYRSLPLGGSPYDPTKMGYPLVSFYLFGQEIWGILNATLDMDDNQFFVQIAGGEYKFRPAGPEFDQADPASGKVDYLLVGGSPLNPAGLYKVATNFYTASFLALFGVRPRNASGAQVDIGETRVDGDPITPGIQEVKCWEALAGYVKNMPDLDGDGLRNVAPAYRYTRARITTPDWYLAEGATAGGMETYVLVQNPGDSDVHARIKFQTGSGEVSPTDLKDVVIPAHSRRTFPVNAWVRDYDVSTLVQPISPRGAQLVCERAMYGNGWRWAHDSTGVTGPYEPAPEWYFAEGCTGGDMETWLLVQNPYGSTIHVDIAFQTGSGEVVAPEDLKDVPIPARSRRTFFVNSWVDSYDVSIMVEALDGNVICERAMYGGGRTWATDSKGTSVLSDQWYLAEGATAGGMETYVLVQNPGDDPVHVNVTFQTGGGEVAPLDLQNVEIPARTRRTFLANRYVTGYDVSTVVTCADGAVAVERAMYGNGWRWGHASVGIAQPSNIWYLAEGATAGGMETYVLVQNPGDDPVHVNVTFQTGGGEVAPLDLQNVEIPARTRRTFPVNLWVTGYDVSTMVRCLDGEVVVERSMYGNGWEWGHCSLGYSPGTVK